MNQVLVNCSVFCLIQSRTVFPWTILKVPELELSFADFFEHELRKRVSQCHREFELVSACAGKSKDILDEVDLLLQVQSVVSLFGPYIKYRIKMFTRWSSTTSRWSANCGNESRCKFVHVYTIRKNQYSQSKRQFCGLNFFELCGFPMIYVRKLQCGNPIERLYYSVGYTPICIYCGIDITTNASSPGTYPQCQNCLNRPPVQKKRWLL